MQALKTIGHQLFGLFVADARFTLALVAWIAIAGAIPLLLERSPDGAALLFFAGFAVVLVENLLHVAVSEHRRG
jgi:hypothetical protein